MSALCGHQLIIGPAGYASMYMDISMDIHVKSVDTDMNMDVKFHIWVVWKHSYNTIVNTIQLVV